MGLVELGAIQRSGCMHGDEVEELAVARIERALLRQQAEDHDDSKRAIADHQRDRGADARGIRLAKHQLLRRQRLAEHSRSGIERAESRTVDAKTSERRELRVV